MSSTSGCGGLCALLHGSPLHGPLLQGPLLVLGLPFLVAGALKAAYDLTLWAFFRRVRPG